MKLVLNVQNVLYLDEYSLLKSFYYWNKDFSVFIFICGKMRL